MDIRKGGDYPSNKLSNLAPNEFIIDGVKCASMEGFLQGLKFKNIDMQLYVCSLTGSYAKKKGANKNWKKDQTLYWQGKSIKRDSKEYQELLDRAYNELSNNEGFKKALLSTGNAVLTHTLGRKKINETILTANEFCSRLTCIRERIRNEK